MRLTQRVEKLEATLAVCRLCGKPAGGAMRVVRLRPGEPRPPAGCPACERRVVVRMRPIRRSPVRPAGVPGP